MARILIPGTLAYDDIGHCDTPLTPGLRNVKLHRLDRAFGGCAMNLAYNLAGLGHRAVPFVYAGDDYSESYARHVAACGISEAGIFRIGDVPSARGIVLTDAHGNQFTAFYPGPSGLDRWPRDLDAVLGDGPFDAAILAPDLIAKTRGCADRLSELPLVVWCPGQYAEILARADVEALLAHAALVVANRHEWQALCRHVPVAELLAEGRRAVVTAGPEPVEILPGGARVPVPPAAAGSATDPTGCGDAFVAALTGALLAGAPIEAAAREGIRLAGRCLACRGAQAHACNW